MNAKILVAAITIQCIIGFLNQLVLGRRIDNLREELVATHAWARTNFLNAEARLQNLETNKIQLRFILPLDLSEPPSDQL